MKRMLAITTFVIAVFAVGTVIVSAESYGDLTYIISNGEVAITNCSETACGEIIIPDTIEGYPVTTIGKSAFSNCAGITDVIFGDYVRFVGDSAFCWCGALKKVTMGNSVKYIEPNAFYCCYNLKDIIIPDSVIKIGMYAFFDCALTSLVIPDSVTTIGEYAFEKCDITSVDFGDSLEFIGSYAFSCCSLENITIPSNVKKIEFRAFYDNDLKNVYYEGSESEWKQICNDSAWSWQCEPTIHYVNHTRTSILEDGKEFIISPINVETGNLVILVIYDGGKFVETQQAVYVGNEIPFTTSKSYKEAKVMIWDSFSNLKPICDVEVVR